MALAKLAGPALCTCGFFIARLLPWRSCGHGLGVQSATRRSPAWPAWAVGSIGDDRQFHRRKSGACQMPPEHRESAATDQTIWSQEAEFVSDARFFGFPL
jgi:hypothetical protein